MPMNCMTLRRRAAIALVAGTAASFALPLAAQDKFPSKPINLIIAAGPGASTDAMGRLVGEALSRQVGQPVVAFNRQGGGGLIAIRAVQAAPTDGYTLMFQTNAVVIEQVVRKGSFDIRKDLIPVARAMEASFGLFVSNQLPVNSLPELVDYAKKNPGKVNFASSGVGGAAHLASESWRLAAGLDMVHVPYPTGSAAVMPALIAGDVGVFINEMSYMKPFVADKRIKVLGTLATQRSPLYPDTPAMPEAGVPQLKDFTAPLLFGVFVAAGTPPERVEFLNQAINKALAEPAVREKLIALGYSPGNIGGHTPAEFRKQINDELVRTEKVVRDAGISVQ